MRITESQLVYEAITYILQAQELSKVTLMKNGCYAVGFSGKGTIISGKKVQALLDEKREYLYNKACVRKLVANSKTVEFVKHYTNSSYTDKGYRVTLNSCSCLFHKVGNPICKHQIAYAKLNGISSLSQFIEARK